MLTPLLASPLAGPGVGPCVNAPLPSLNSMEAVFTPATMYIRVPTPPVHEPPEDDEARASWLLQRRMRCAGSSGSAKQRTLLRLGVHSGGSSSPCHLRMQEEEEEEDSYYYYNYNPVLDKIKVQPPRRDFLCPEEYSAQVGRVLGAGGVEMQGQRGCANSSWAGRLGLDGRQLPWRLFTFSFNLNLDPSLSPRMLGRASWVTTARWGACSARWQ